MENGGSSGFDGCLKGEKGRPEAKKEGDAEGCLEFPGMTEGDGDEDGACPAEDEEGVIEYPVDEGSCT